MEMCTFVCKVHDDSPAQLAGLKVGEYDLADFFFFNFPFYLLCKLKILWKTLKIDMTVTERDGRF